MKFSVDLLTICIGVVLPIVTGVVTKIHASSKVKASMLAFLSVLAGVLSAGIQSDGFISKEAAGSALIAWVTAVATYYGFWKPIGASDSVNTSTGGFGVGSGSYDPGDPL